MADPTNITRGAASTTRRQVFALAGGAAASAALALPAAASEPLVELWALYQRLDAECGAADDACWAAMHKRPDAPPCICRQGGKVGGEPYLIPMDPDELQRLFDEDAKWRGKARAEQAYGPRLKAMEEWRRACDASDELHGVAALNQKVDDLFLRASAVLDQILNTLPRSLQGLAVWLEVMERHMSPSPDEPERDWPIETRVMHRLLPAIRAMGA